MRYHVKEHFTAKQRRAMAAIQSMEVNPFVKVNAMAETLTQARHEFEVQRSFNSHSISFITSFNDDRHDFTD